MASDDPPSSPEGSTGNKTTTTPGTSVASQEQRQQPEEPPSRPLSWTGPRPQDGGGGNTNTALDNIRRTRAILRSITLNGTSSSPARSGRSPLPPGSPQATGDEVVVALEASGSVEPPNRLGLSSREGGRPRPPRRANNPPSSAALPVWGPLNVRSNDRGEPSPAAAPSPVARLAIGVPPSSNNDSHEVSSSARAPFPHTSISAGGRTPGLMAMQLLLFRVIEGYRSQMDPGDTEPLNDLENKVRTQMPRPDTSTFMPAFRDKVAKWYQTELGEEELPEQVKQRIGQHVMDLTMSLCHLANEVIQDFEAQSAFTRTILEQVCHVVDEATAGPGVEPHELTHQMGDQYPALVKKKLMTMRKSELADYFMKRDNAREQEKNINRVDWDDFDAKLTAATDELHRVNQQRDQERSDNAKEVREKVAVAIKAYEDQQQKAAAEAAAAERKDLQNPAYTWVSSSNEAHVDGPARFNTQGGGDARSQTTEELEAADAVQRRSEAQEEAKQLIRETAAKFVTVREVSDNLVRRLAGRQSSVPASERSSSSIATTPLSSSSSSARNFPSQPNSARSGPTTPQRMDLELGRFQSESSGSLASSPQPVSAAPEKPVSDPGLPTPSESHTPSEQQHSPTSSVRQTSSEGHASPGPRTSDVRPIKVLVVIARHLEKSLQVPPKFDSLFEKLDQVKGIGEVSMAIQIARDHCKAATLQLRKERPVTLSAAQIEQAPIHEIKEWIDWAGPFLDSFTDFLVNQIEQLAKLAQQLPQPREPVLEESEWLRNHMDGQRCQNCRSVRDFVEECINHSKTTDERGDDGDEQRKREEHTQEPHQEAKVEVEDHRRTSSPSQRIFSSFAGSKFRQRRPRPESIDIKTVAERQLTPQSSATKSSSETSSTCIPPSQIGNDVSPMPEAPDQEDAGAPAAVAPTTGPAAQASQSTPVPAEPLTIQGYLFPHGADMYICTDMAVQKPERPVKKGSEQVPKQPTGYNPALWQQLLALLYYLIRWLTWGQLFNLWTMLTFTWSILKYWWGFLCYQGVSVVLTPALRKRSLRPLQAPEIPEAAFASLSLWVFLAWNTTMLVSVQEERKLWLAANPRTASYLRGLSGRYPYPAWWLPQVDYALFEPARDGFRKWLHEAYFGSGITALVGAFYDGNAPAVVQSALRYLADGAKEALVQGGIKDGQDMVRVM